MTQHNDETPGEFDMAVLDRAITEMDAAQYSAELAATDAIAIAYAARRLGAEYLDQGDLTAARRWYSLAAEHDPCGAGAGLAEIEQAHKQQAQAQAADTSEAPRGRTTSPLQGCGLFRSNDPDTVREAVGKILCPHSLEIVEKKEKFEAELRSRRLRDISLFDLSYGCEVSLSVGTMQDFFTVLVPLYGQVTVTQGAAKLRGNSGRVVVTSPAEPLTIHLSSGCRLLVCRVERTALEAQLSELLNAKLSAPLQFDLGMDLTHDMGRRWYDILAGLTRFVNAQDKIGTPPRFVGGMEQSLMTGLLIAQPSNYSDFLREKASRKLSPIARCALDLIASRPQWPHTARSLARDAGVSARALQQAFQGHVGCSPTEYLREVRLRRTHDELRARSSELASVGEVAKRWGFRDPGRFAAVYRERFGESPSETLKRDRTAEFALVST